MRPNAAPIHPWERPSGPWERVHIDHAGPVEGKMLLVACDAYSKWVEVDVVRSTDAKSSATVLRRWFAMHGLPKVVVSDNGPGFASEEFNDFLRSNGIRHIFTAPYHPSSNGQAERTVRTLKDALKVLKGDIETKLCRFLFKYRITPQTCTNKSPAELLLGRQLRSALSLLHPTSEQAVPSENHDNVVGKCRKFDLDDEVFVRNFGVGERWMPGVVVSVLGEVNYKVLLADGRILHRHIDQIMKRYTSNDKQIVETLGLTERGPCSKLEVVPERPGYADRHIVPIGPNQPPVVGDLPVETVSVPSRHESIPASASDRAVPPAGQVPQAAPLRRSNRVRHRPAKLDDYV